MTGVGEQGHPCVYFCVCLQFFIIKKTGVDTSHTGKVRKDDVTIWSANQLKPRARVWRSGCLGAGHGERPTALGTANASGLVGQHQPGQALLFPVQNPQQREGPTFARRQRGLPPRLPG